MYKKIINAFIMIILLLSLSINTYANMDSTITNNNKEQLYDINKQINELYETVSKNLNLDVKYIKILHYLAGGRADYIDELANIYDSYTISNEKEPMKISGAKTIYRKAEFIESSNSNIIRPSAYYLPDAVYSVSYDIKALMSQRLFVDRGGYQKYFDSLTSDTKNNILFYEAVLKYIGESDSAVNNLFSVYIDILTVKNSNESVIKINDNNCMSLKNIYKNMFIHAGVVSTRSLETLAILLSFDKNLVTYESSDNIFNDFVMPYENNKTSLENMMKASMSLVGKVRYVWGGGHGPSSNIESISPTWESFNNLYLDGQSCIMSYSGECPFHEFEDETMHGETIYSINEYIAERKDSLNLDEVHISILKNLFMESNFSDGVNIHTLDGLDCSGYVSWIYNQVTDRYKYDAVAAEFYQQDGIEQLELDSEILPGDFIAWKSHIVFVVGKLNNDKDTYIILEQTPNKIRFGVMYYSGASQNNINKAFELATEANNLIGNINSEYEKANIYCFDTIGYYNENVIDEDGTVILDDNCEAVTIEKYFLSIGRIKEHLIDDNIKVEEYNSTMKNMTAKDIIENTLCNLPLSYIKGYNVYNGNIFNIEKIERSHYSKNE